MTAAALNARIDHLIAALRHPSIAFRPTKRAQFRKELFTLRCVRMAKARDRRQRKAA